MKRPKLNRFMERWVIEAIKDCPEPFSAKQIHDRILLKRNSHYVQSSNSVGYYLSYNCMKKVIKGKNMYWRKDK